MGEGKAIRKGIAATYIRLAVYLLASLLYPPYLLSKVGADNNGLYFFASSLASALLLLSFGIENAYVRFATRSAAEGEEKLAKTNGVFLSLFAIGALAMAVLGIAFGLLISGGVIGIEGDAKTAGYLVLILSLSGAIDFFFSFFSWQNYFRRRFVFIQCVLTISHLAGIGLSVLLLYYGYGIIETALAVSAGALLMDIVYFIEARFVHPSPVSLPKGNEWKVEAKEIYSFSFYIFLAVIVSTVYSNAGRLILGLSYDAGLAVTVFGYGLQFYSYESLLSKAVSNSFSPALNRYAEEGKKEEIGSLWQRGSFVQTLILLFVVGGFVSSGYAFVNFWLGDSLGEADLLMVYILAACFLVVFLLPLGTSLSTEVERAYGKHRFPAVFSLIAAIIAVLLATLLALFLPDEWKIYGVFFGLAPSIVATAIMKLVYSKKVLGLPVGGYFKKAAVPTCFMVLSCVAPLALWLTGVLSSLAYIWQFLILGCAYALLFLLLSGIWYRKDIKVLLNRFLKKAP